MGHHRSRQDILAVAQEVALVAHIDNSGRAMGHQILQAAISSQAGIRLHRADVLEDLREHDPAAVSARRERLLPRRTCDIVQSMQLWHVDSATVSAPVSVNLQIAHGHAYVSPWPCFTSVALFQKAHHSCLSLQGSP